VPTVRFAGRAIECPHGANLRIVLLRARLPLYNNLARALNCRGYGTCGTCAVRIEGKVSDLTTAERMRLEFPPHEREAGLRLACQCSVLGDLVVTKHSGVWGTGEEVASPPPSRAR
jgi:ferredoxin